MSKRWLSATGRVPVFCSVWFIGLVSMRELFAGTGDLSDAIQRSAAWTSFSRESTTSRVGSMRNGVVRSRQAVEQRDVAEPGARLDVGERDLLARHRHRAHAHRTLGDAA